MQETRIDVDVNGIPIDINGNQVSDNTIIEIALYYDKKNVVKQQINGTRYDKQSMRRMDGNYGWPNSVNVARYIL